MSETKKKQELRKVVQHMHANIARVPYDTEPLSKSELRAIQQSDRDFANGDFEEIGDIKW